MTRYEITFGIYVDADNVQHAMEQIGRVVALLNELDVEGEAAIEGPTPVG